MLFEVPLFDYIHNDLSLLLNIASSAWSWKIVGFGVLCSFCRQLWCIFLQKWVKQTNLYRPSNGLFVLQIAGKNLHYDFKQNEQLSTQIPLFPSSMPKTLIGVYHYKAQSIILKSQRIPPLVAHWIKPFYAYSKGCHPLVTHFRKPPTIACKGSNNTILMQLAPNFSSWGQLRRMKCVQLERTCQVTYSEFR